MENQEEDRVLGLVVMLWLILHVYLNWSQWRDGWQVLKAGPSMLGLDDGLQMMATFSRTPTNWTEPSWLTDGRNQTVSLTRSLFFCFLPPCLPLFLSLIPISLHLHLLLQLPWKDLVGLRAGKENTDLGKKIKRKKNIVSWLVAAHFCWSDQGSNSKPLKGQGHGQRNLTLSDSVSLINRGKKSLM